MAVEIQPSMEKVKMTPHFAPASDFGILDQRRLEHKTNGSFQNGYYDETTVYYPFDGVGLIFHPRLGFHLLEKGKGEPVTDLAGVTYTDKVTALPDAMIAYDTDGRVHVVWPADDDEAMFGDLSSITITPGVAMKNITYNPKENINNLEEGILLDAAKEAFNKKYERERPTNVVLFAA